MHGKGTTESFGSRFWLNDLYMPSIASKFISLWIRLLMQPPPLSRLGRLASHFIAILAPPYKDSTYLANLNPKGYVAPSAAIRHANLKLGQHVFIGERCTIYQSQSGSVELGDHIHLYSDIIIETGFEGQIVVGAETHIQPRCQLMAYVGSLSIGSRCEIAPNCTFYPYNHGIAPEQDIMSQHLLSSGGIRVGNGVWLGVGATILDGVTIGDGAVIGAASLVTRDIPANAVAYGSPAQVHSTRSLSAQEKRAK
jgi:acetyltransferase-like isoleucine patch superfamily enzyme